MTLAWTLVAVLATWPFTAEVPDARVVARAQGPAGPIEITAGRLRAYAALHPHRSPRALATELIEFELLAAEAARRGLARDPEVADAVRPALVLRYLKSHFETTWRAETVPEDLVAQSYERNRGFFVHPDLVTADHIVLTRGRARPDDRAAEAQALMEALRASLVADPPADADAFIARAQQFQEQAKAIEVELRGEKLGRFAQRGRLDPDFTAQVFRLETPGALTEVFTTRFGWHIARLAQREPAQDRSLADVSAELRARILPEVRELKLRALTESLAQQWGAEIDEEPLKAQAVE